jgi:DNA-binding beta-propeller fold protein YncE
VARSRYALCAAAAILVVISVFASTASAKPDPGGVLVEGLNNPRGIAAGGGGSVLVAESGNGKLTLVEPRRRGAPAVRTFATLPVDPESGLGPVDVAFKSLRKVWALLSGPPEEGGEFGRLVRLNRKGAIVESVDIAGYQTTDPDPDDQEGIPDASNPNGLALLPGGGVLVVDAEGNDLLKVDTRRRITTVARFKPELLPWPSGLPFPGPVEPGELFPVESVPTAVAIGPDGAWYVSELKGFPFPKGASRLWRIEPGAVEATCDPASPNVGPCRTVATGFTSVIDLAFGRDGTMYVLEIVKEGLLSVEVFGGPPIGALWAVKGGTKTELATGTLLAPGGVAVSYDGTLNVTTGTLFGPGAGAVVRVRP